MNPKLIVRAFLCRGAGERWPAVAGWGSGAPGSVYSALARPCRTHSLSNSIRHLVKNGETTSVVDRHCFDADPDPDRTLSLTDIGKSETFFYTAVCFIFLVRVFFN
jgi:hypothetical protein